MQNFVEMVRNGEPVQGTFLKTFAPPLVEILSYSGLDFLVIDAEHAPFGVRDIDALVLAARGCRLPVLVRALDHSPKFIQQVLDIGVEGVVIPQVDSADQARSIVSATKFLGGKRGFSSSTRSAGFGTASIESVLDSLVTPLVVCQIESLAGVENCGEIAAVEGVDMIFIGRADLAVDLGEKSVKAESVLQAVSRIFETVKAVGKPVGAMVGSAEEAQEFRDRGASLLIRGSDQAMLLKAVRESFGERGLRK